MTVHDLGYRSWQGRLNPGWTRLFVIAVTGVRRSWQNRWLRRTILFAWLPTLWFGFGLFAWEQSLVNPSWGQAVESLINNLPDDSELTVVLQTTGSDPDQSRHAVWSWLLASFFRYSQALLMVLVVGFVAPGLISQDIRSRAFLLYFSRPVNRVEYVGGKVLTIWFYLASMATIPALGLYVLGILFSPQLNVLQATWDIPLRILVASTVLMVPTSILALCLSSMTQESRYAAFGWFAIWVLGWFTYGLMSTVQIQRQQSFDLRASQWVHVSLYHILGRVQSWIFGFADDQEAATSAAILGALTLLALVVLFRQVASPMRA